MAISEGDILQSEQTVHFLFGERYGLFLKLLRNLSLVLVILFARQMILLKP